MRVKGKLRSGLHVKHKATFGPVLFPPRPSTTACILSLLTSSPYSLWILCKPVFNRFNRFNSIRTGWLCKELALSEKPTITKKEFIKLWCMQMNEQHRCPNHWPRCVVGTTEWWDMPFTFLYLYHFPSAPPSGFHNKSRNSWLVTRSWRVLATKSSYYTLCVFIQRQKKTIHI